MSHQLVFSPITGTLKKVKLTYRRVPARRVRVNATFIPLVREPNLEELRSSMREIIRTFPESQGVLVISCISGCRNTKPRIKVFKSDTNIRQRFLSIEDGDPYTWVFELLYIAGYREIHFQLASVA
jgi:hypothetical protein